MRFITALSALFLAFPLPLLALTAAADVSAVVSKAEFGTSGVSVGLEEHAYEINVRLVNSGDAASETASVFVLFQDTLAYAGAAQTDGVITTHGSALGQFIEWRLTDVRAKQEESLTLTFTPVGDEKLPNAFFSVAIVSPVSLPIIKRIRIGADTEPHSYDFGRFRQFLNVSFLRIYSLKYWLTVSPFWGRTR